MNRESLPWIIVILIGAALLAGRAMLAPDGMGKAYIKPVEKTFVNVPPDQVKAEATDAEEAQAGTPVEQTEGFEPDVERGDPGRAWVSADDLVEDFDIDGLADEHVVTWGDYEKSNYLAYLQQPQGSNEIIFSLSHSIGIWVGALLTLFVLSFLINDNPLYKIAESMFVGISAAYWMVVGFWDTLVPNLLGKLLPDVTKAWAMPGLGQEARFEPLYLIPLVFSVLLLMRLSPKGGWLSRWPMAFFIGTFCGFRLIAFIHGDFLAQIRNSIVPLYALDPITGSFDLWESVRSIILIVGVLACLTYFFFSFEHKGVVGGTARLGIWFLMITFGAAFAYTVMGRIALLAIRIEFLLDDWLWLIDPTNRRAVDPTALITGFGFM